ncbi:MAG: hypothetical protein IPJ40_22705 [Saprospirales bacterium]|nr:hypothetical protein [Saprospirales bacterium]
MMKVAKWKILLADDHCVVREGIKFVLQQMPEMRDAVVEEIAKGSDLLPVLKKNSFDLLILDIFWKEWTG